MKQLLIFNITLKAFVLYYRNTQTEKKGGAGERVEGC